jgi:hypothetical protein
MCWFCKHQYVLIDTIAVYSDSFFTYTNKKDLPAYHLFVTQCKKCGKIKKVKV